MLEKQSLTTITVADITQEAGFSIGAFYRRFENRDVFFDALLQAALEEAAATMQDLFEGKKDYASFADRFARTIIQRHVKYRAVYRAAALRGYNNPEERTPTKEYARTVLSRLREWSEIYLGRSLSRAETVQMSMSFQVLNGTILNALVGNPGPMRLEDPEFENELARIFRDSLSHIFAKARKGSP